jgi:hypothetical protein
MCSIYIRFESHELLIVRFGDRSVVTLSPRLGASCKNGRQPSYTGSQQCAFHENKVSNGISLVIHIFNENAAVTCIRCVILRQREAYERYTLILGPSGIDRPEV